MPKLRKAVELAALGQEFRQVVNFIIALHQGPEPGWDMLEGVRKRPEFFGLDANIFGLVFLQGIVYVIKFALLVGQFVLAVFKLGL